MDVMDYRRKLPERACEPIRELARLLMEELRKSIGKLEFRKMIKVEPGPVLRNTNDISLGVEMRICADAKVKLNAEYEDLTDTVWSHNILAEGSILDVYRWLEEDHLEELASKLEYLYWNTHTWD